MKRGRFLVLEGLDGAGTTTQTARLARRLSELGHEVQSTREPSDGPIGSMLRLIMGGRVVSPPGTIGWDTMALLFAADRLDHVHTEIEPCLARGGVVISDRYDASSIGYQSVTSGADERAVQWIRTLNQRALRPDLVIVVDVDDDTAARRRAGRGGAPQLYEQNETQRALRAFYRELPAQMPEDRVEVISGEGTADEVEARIWACVTAALPELGCEVES